MTNDQAQHPAIRHSSFVIADFCPWHRGGFALYGSAVIGFLRFIGLLNAAVWFGAAVFQTFGAGPALASRQMQELLTPGNYPYYSVAIAQLVDRRYFQLQLVCCAVAVLHAVAEWLYLGQVPARFWRWLLLGLLAANLAAGLWLQPASGAAHRLAYGLRTPPETRKSALREFRAWHGAAEVLNFMVVGGLGVYLWRMANPPDSTRYVSTTKFRS